MQRTTILGLLSFACAMGALQSNALAQHKLDHFKLYLVEPHEAEFKVTLKGQFDKEPKVALLTKLSQFAVVVRKNKEEIVDKNAHLTFYEIKQEEEEPGRVVKIENQFGEQKFRIGHAVGILVPAEKVEDGLEFPKELDHYKCYRVLRGAEPVDKAVALADQFRKDEVKVGLPTMFCVPVVKRHGDKEYKINNEKDHLTFYAITATPDTEKTKGVVDQFDKRKLRITRGVMLGVPTYKLAFEVEE